MFIWYNAIPYKTQKIDILFNVYVLNSIGPLICGLDLSTSLTSIAHSVQAFIYLAC
jgi:hypothetical protein